MPNWCENDLYVTGSREDVAKFQEFAKLKTNNKLISANSFIPYPEKFAIADEKCKLNREILNALPMALSINIGDVHGWGTDGYNAGGYEWCIANWGTKWDLCDVQLVEESMWSNNKIQVTYFFNTAWYPPIPIIEAMGKKFPSLEFRLDYFEQSAAFNGCMIIEKRECVYHQQGNYFCKQEG
jgi:hypothetical protein